MPSEAPKVVERLARSASTLTRSEAKAAGLLERAPQEVAFGSLLDVARAAGTSGPSVVRLANKLGYAGFAELREAIQAEMAERLAPAAERIGAHVGPLGAVAGPGDSADGQRAFARRVAEAEIRNIERSLEDNASRLQDAARLLADQTRSIGIIAAVACRPLGAALADQLVQLRPGVTEWAGPPTEIARQLAWSDRRDIVVVIDLRRYERWVVDTAALAAEHGHPVVALTDTPLSPLVSGAAVPLFIRAVGAGPFDSLTGGLALVNALGVAVADRRSRPAAARLRSAEELLSATGALLDPGGDPATAAAAAPRPLRRRTPR